MSQPVKLSDSLVLDARLTGELVERSIASQIEFWAALGRSIEPLLRLPEILALKKAGSAKSLSDCLAEIGTSTGTRKLDTYLKSIPFPHYEPSPKHPGLLIRIEKNGTSTTGRFINRRFTPIKSPKK